MMSVAPESEVTPVVVQAAGLVGSVVLSTVVSMLTVEPNDRAARTGNHSASPR